MDIKQMMDAILKQRSDLTQKDLMRMIEEKKKRIGAGYLTDQGALFLVAADLGVSIEQVPQLEMSLKDLYAGAREVTVLARVMKIYPLKRFSRNDGSSATLRTLVIYDNDASVRVSLWDDLAILPDRLGLKVGDAVRISKAYVKSTPDGRVTLNAGTKSSMEIVEENVPHIRDLDSMLIDVSEITDSENAVVSGSIKATPRISDFRNFRGESSKVLHLQLAGADDRVFRVMIWNIDEHSLPKVMNIGARVRLVGVRTKRNQYGELELHGDEGTSVEIAGEQEEIDVIQLRIISVSKEKNVFVLAIDKDKEARTLIINNLALIDSLEPDRMIECIPSRIYGSTLIMDDDSYLRVIDDIPSFPKASMLEKKINAIVPSSDLYFIEAITLFPARAQDLQIKDESVRYAETLLGDDTGEIRLVGWREQAQMVEKLGTGKRVKVYGVTAHTGRDGNIELRIKPFSSIVQIDQ